MAHARRKFHEALQKDPPRAEYVLGLFRQLFIGVGTLSSFVLKEGSK
jgi:hypothetical protein